MKKAVDSEIIRENRKYLDEYYNSGNKKDNITTLCKMKRIFKTFGIKGLIHKFKKNKSVNKMYESNVYEENCPEITLKKKIAVYTAIIGKYDDLLEPKYISPNCDYYVFTDMDIPKNSIWKKMPLPKTKEYLNLGTYQQAKYFKIFPHKLFPKYDYSIWVDGNIHIYGDLAPFVDRMDKNFLAEFEHPTNNCVYDEAYSIVSQGKAKGKDVKKQINQYKKEKFPTNYGLLENSFIIRKHNDKRCINLMNTWWAEMKKFTWRDQLSLTYSMWKNGIGINDITILGPCWRWNPRLRQKDHIL